MDILWLFATVGLVIAAQFEGRTPANLRANMLRQFLESARSVRDGNYSHRDLQIIQSVVNRSQSLREYVNDNNFKGLKAESVTSYTSDRNNDRFQDLREKSIRLSKLLRNIELRGDERGYERTQTERIDLYEMFERLAKLVEDLPPVIYCNLFVCRGRQPMEVTLLPDDIAPEEEPEQPEEEPEETEEEPAELEEEPEETKEEPEDTEEEPKEPEEEEQEEEPEETEELDEAEEVPEEPVEDPDAEPSAEED